MKRLAADVAQDEFSGSLVGNQHRAEFAVLLEDLHLGRLDVLGAARRCRLCQRLLFGRRGTVSCQPAVSERASDDENGDNIQAGVNARSEERRVGKEWGSKCRYRWWQDH